MCGSFALPMAAVAIIGVAPMVGGNSRKQRSAPSKSSEGMPAGGALIAHPRSRGRPLGSRWEAPRRRSRPRWGWESLRTPGAVLRDPCLKCWRVKLEPDVTPKSQAGDALGFRCPFAGVASYPALRNPQAGRQFFGVD